jgi:hypothetical protein
MSISRLKRIPIREVWKNEEKDFTPWLEKNIDVLGETLGMSLSVVERERAVGKFFEADILAEDQNGDYVVIENQFGESDHDHLGKLLTYLTNLEAKTAVWICENPRPEHINVIDWLNEICPPDIRLYLIKLEVFQIENSPPAPHLSVIAAPSEPTKEAGTKKKELAERHLKRLEFWRQLLDKSRGKTDLFVNVSPSKENWLSTGAGRTGLSYCYVILMDSARVELYIDTPRKEENKRIFDALYKERERIEADFGERLEWQRLDDRKASRIARTIEGKGLKDVDAWADLQEKMIDAMIRLERAFKERIKGI